MHLNSPNISTVSKLSLSIPIVGCRVIFWGFV